MKIAIYEPIHLDWIIPLCDFFSQRKDQVFFFTVTAFENDIRAVLQNRYQQFSFFYFDEHMSRSSFRYSLHKFFDDRDFDLILLNSVDSRHLFLYEAIRRKNAKLVINIHDVHNFFRAGFSFHPRQFLRTVGKRVLARRADAYIANAKAMKDYILSSRFTDRLVFWIPPVITKAVPPNRGGEQFIITIPGSIDEKRRDYNLVLAVYKQLATQHPGKVRLFLAGRPVGPYGQSIIVKARQLNASGLLVDFYEEEIPEEHFQNLIAQSTLLWSPLQSSTAIHDNIDEKYGETKVSGNVYDAIRHGKPLLVPAGLRVPEEIQTSTLFYGSANIAASILLHQFDNPAELFALTQKAYQNAQQFSLENGLLKLDTMLRTVHSLPATGKHVHLPKK